MPPLGCVTRHSFSQDFEVNSLELRAKLQMELAQEHINMLNAEISTAEAELNTGLSEFPAETGDTQTSLRVCPVNVGG